MLFQPSTMISGIYRVLSTRKDYGFEWKLNDEDAII
jgi:hypothetical protein